MNKDEIALITVVANYGICRECGEQREIGHTSEFDKETQNIFYKKFKVREGWIVCCHSCDTIGVIEE